MSLEGILTLVVIVEALIAFLSTIYVHNPSLPFLDRVSWKAVLSIVVGQLVVFGFGIEILQTAGFDVPSIPDKIVSGLMIARGSNFIHDIFSITKSMKESRQ